MLDIRHDLQRMGRPRALLLTVVLLGLLLGLVEGVGLLSFPALMQAVGWDGRALLDRLPRGLATWVESLGAMRGLALLPILAFALVGSLQHLRAQLETRLMLAWHERLFREGLHALVGGEYPRLARLSEHDAAHLLAVQTARGATALMLLLRLLLLGGMLLVQLAVALLLFGVWALSVALGVAAAFGLLFALRRHWGRIGDEWSSHSEALFDRVLAGLRGWETLLTDPRSERWLENFHAPLKEYLRSTERFFISLERTSAVIHALGAAVCILLIGGAYWAGGRGGGLMMLGLLILRGVPLLKGWARSLQEWWQHRDALRELPLGALAAAGVTAPSPSFPLQVEALSFGYEPERPVLAGVTLALPATGLIGLGGPNGSGKTTLLRLLAHLLPPTGGSVPDLRGHLAYLPATPFIWGASLSEYLEVADLTDARLTNLLAALWPEHAVPQELLTLKTEAWGARLSLGTRQKVALLRVLLMPAPILLLDEPTQHLDPEARRGVLRLLGERARQGLVLVVSQDTELLSRCDVGYRLEAGRLERSVSS